MDAINIGTKILVHLDLKGGSPKISYFEKLFPLLQQWGATGLLIEWEDTFPYWGEQLSVIGSSGPDSPGVYSKQEVEQILSFAAQFSLEVVPLVQTFGHLEFVLKHDAFRNLREVEKFPSSMCPSQPDSLLLVQALLSQIIQMHPGIQMLHIGADEVWHMGLCDICKKRMSSMEQNSSPRDRLFLEHVRAVLSWLKGNHPTIKFLMWDDMLRHMDPLLLQEYELGSLVEPMVWHYRPAKTFNLPHDLWSKYNAAFQGMWVATAFKGASGSNVHLPEIALHVDCQERWLRELANEKSSMPPVRGVTITGWSRYDHYAVMCELLPVSLPSLALCLAQWRAGAFTPEVHTAVSQELGYLPNELLPLHSHLLRPQPSLNFPGWKIRNGIEWLVSIQIKTRGILESEQVLTWLSPWMVKRSFTNPMQLSSLCHSLPMLLDELASLERFLRPALEAIFPPIIVEEWIGTIMEPGRNQLRKLLQEAEQQMAIGGRIRSYQQLQT